MIKHSINCFFKKNTTEQVYFLLLFFLTTFAFSIPFGYQYGKYSLAFVAILYFFVFKKKDLYRVFANRIFQIILIFIVVQLISLLWSDNLDYGISYLKVFVTKLIVPLFFILAILRDKDKGFLISGFILGMFTNEIIAYLIYFDLFETTYSIKHPHPVGFIHHIPYSLLVSFTAILILYQINFLKNRYLKILNLVFFMTMVMNLVISGGRNGYIAFFVTLFILLFTYYRVSISNIAKILLLPITIFFISYLLDDSSKQRVNAAINDVKSVIQKNHYDTSVGARIAMYPLTIDILKQPNNSIYLGVGVGDVFDELKKAQKRTGLLNMYVAHLHNSYLEAYLSSGIISLGLYIAIFVLLWKIELGDSRIEFMKQLLVITFVIAGFGSRIFHSKEMLFFFALFLAIILIKKEKEDEEKSEQKLSCSLKRV